MLFMTTDQMNRHKLQTQPAVSSKARTDQLDITQSISLTKEYRNCDYI